MARDPNRKLCGARLACADFDRIREHARRQGKDPDLAVRARLRHGGACMRPALPGCDRCRWHGGHSTGATSEAGKARTAAGRARWLAARKAAGLPLTMGRKPGKPNRPREIIEQEKRAREAARALRRIAYRARADRRARKEAARLERDALAMFDVARERFHAGASWAQATEHADKYDRGLDLRSGTVVEISGAALDAALAAIAARGPSQHHVVRVDRLARQFVERLRDTVQPMTQPEAFANYDRMVKLVQAITPTDRRQSQLDELRDALNAFRTRLSNDRMAARVTAARKMDFASNRPPALPLLPTRATVQGISPDSSRGEAGADDHAESSEAPPVEYGWGRENGRDVLVPLTELQRGYAITQAIVAGRDARAVQRAAQFEPARPARGFHSAAPWLYRRR